MVCSNANITEGELGPVWKADVWWDQTFFEQVGLLKLQKSDCEAAGRSTEITDAWECVLSVH